jgi:hypothetical protein
MSALLYKIPPLARVLCNHPVCQEPATFLVHPKDDKPGIPSCTPHLDQYHVPGVRLEKLLTVGKLNVKGGEE